MYSQLKTKNQHKKHFCMACLQNFTTKKILNNHKKKDAYQLMELKQLYMKQEQLNLKTSIIKYQSHLKFMLIQNV